MLKDLPVLTQTHMDDDLSMDRTALTIPWAAGKYADTKNNGISLGFCWPVLFITSRPPPQVECDALPGILSVTMQCGRILLEHTILFWLLGFIFMHPWHLVQGLMSPACLLSWPSDVTHTHTHWTWRWTFAHAHTHSATHLWRKQRERISVVYLAQELSHSRFACMIVLVGHGMRQRKCVSVEEETGGKERERRKENTGLRQQMASLAHRLSKRLHWPCPWMKRMRRRSYQTYKHQCSW